MKTELITDENLSILLEKINYSFKSQIQSIPISRKEENETIQYESVITVGKSRYTILCSKRPSSFLWKDFSTYRIIISASRWDYNESIDTQKMDDKLKDIWNTLNTADEQKEKDKANKRTKEFIDELSTTIDKSFERDDKLDEILK